MLMRTVGEQCLLLLFDDFSADESVKKMEFTVEIGIAFLEQLPLMSRTHAAARSFAVACVQLVDGAHAFYDPAQRREAHRVEARLIACVDVNLCCTSVRASHSKRERPSHVAVLHGIVGEPFVLPDFRNHGIARNAELRESAGNHAEEPRIIVKAHLDEVVEAIGAARRERPSYTEHDDAFCGFNAHAVSTRRRLRPQRIVRIMKRARTLLGRNRRRSRCKQGRKRNEKPQKNESHNQRTHAPLLPLGDDRLSSRATGYVIAVGLPCDDQNQKSRLVPRQDTKAQAKDCSVQPNSWKGSLAESRLAQGAFRIADHPNAIYNSGASAFDNPLGKY